ncbi:hypothetical protein E2C01_047488 [Portunus trituberculatus]|uniref:Uncharacterized protein n=1 Tax=Portunus trituberculatus TaxID=210409 RepID=A0A5B7G901_PORTR|nr:hypothetical protein [Portunus trituberculatus]
MSSESKKNTRTRGHANKVTVPQRSPSASSPPFPPSSPSRRSLPPAHYTPPLPPECPASSPPSTSSHPGQLSLTVTITLPLPESFDPSLRDTPLLPPLPPRHLPVHAPEAMMDLPLAEAVVEQLEEVVGRLSLSPKERHALGKQVELTGAALKEALVFVSARSKELDALEEQLERREMLLEMRELVVAAEVERHTQQLEELSAVLMDKMDALQDLHDALAPQLTHRFRDTVQNLRDATEGEEEARYLLDLLDRREGSCTPSGTPSWPECHSRRGDCSFRIGKEKVFMHAASGEVWVRVRPPVPRDPSDTTDAPSPPDDFTDASPAADPDS